MVVGNDYGARQKVEFKIETSHSFVINKEQQGDIDQHRLEESLDQPREEVFGDADVRKDNLKKLLENEFVMNDLGAKKKIKRMEIMSDRRA